MNIEFDDDLLEDDDEQECESSSQQIPSGKLDARRMLERRLEIKRLREMLDDPAFDDNWIN